MFETGFTVENFNGDSLGAGTLLRAIRVTVSKSEGEGAGSSSNGAETVKLKIEDKSVGEYVPITSASMAFSSWIRASFRNSDFDGPSSGPKQSFARFRLLLPSLLLAASPPKVVVPPPQYPGLVQSSLLADCLTAVHVTPCANSLVLVNASSLAPIIVPPLTHLLAMAQLLLLADSSKVTALRFPPPANLPNLVSASRLLV